MTSIKDVALMRNGSLVSSFFGSFGNDLKETRLTGALGYLIATTPESFSSLFKVNHNIISVSIEEKEAGGRVDIKISTAHEDIDIEAKVSKIDPIGQSLNYKGDRKILITNYIPSRQQRSKRNVLYVNWQEIHDLLLKLSKLNTPAVKFLSSEIIFYLKHHNMVKKDKPVEIYLRELGDENTMKLFMHGHLYACDFISASDLYDAIYFAPHFSNNLEKECPGISAGISHIARIEKLEIVEDWNHFLEVLENVRKKNWLKKHLPLLKKIKSESDKDWNRKMIVFFLGEPIHVFTPPLKKTNLQSGSGWLSKSFLSFDELFKARSEKIY